MKRFRILGRPMMDFPRRAPSRWSCRNPGSGRRGNLKVSPRLEVQPRPTPPCRGGEPFSTAIRVCITGSSAKTNFMP